MKSGRRSCSLIPIVERDNDTGYQEGDQVTDRSITAAGYGQFLIDMYEEWVRRDVGKVFVQIFDIALAAWTGAPPGLCIFDETCGLAMAMEHNGDVFSCDHYVEPDFKLGNIMDVPLSEIVVMDEQVAFGQAKRDTLPQYCLDCEVKFVCNGGCPKNRFISTPAGDPGLELPLRRLSRLFQPRAPDDELHGERAIAAASACQRHAAGGAL